MMILMILICLSPTLKK